MRFAMSEVRRSDCYTIREVALILDVDPLRVSHAIRAGSLRAVLRSGRLLIPAKALMQALDGPTDHGETSTGSNRRSGGGL
ncbi:DNA-binding protein [Actinopolyspora mortivallis]|uniref:Helix-turn-helix domain-containing protein n=1 Tax=Actinopolyspora mortivallis TaxID=33906 RepID=A0A2T0H1V9_ACTMO|nr:DNA-binding protein [Actinopolyspora mortivallis]PRW65336.1 hypothetical protein CEP50_02170 [Actinopolyspora mortivallis]